MSKNKICVITGANSGIGYEMAKSIAKQGHKAVLVCRNQQKGEGALSDIRELYGSESADLIVGNLSFLKDIQNIVSTIQRNYPHLAVIIHNAGIWNSKKNIVEGNLEETFMVNYLSNFYLTYLLMDHLKQSNSARIILVNAGLYPKGEFNPEITPYGDDFSRFKTYMNSKLCGILFMRKLATMLEGTNVTINAIHPGVIRTNLGNFSGIMWIFSKVMRLFMMSSKKGAEGTVRLALSPEIKTNGSFYDKLKEESLAKNALDDDLVQKLWEVSEKLCNVSWDK
ncbi:MAG: SDR family NAD(P)-dependent oxidoreductase [Candidatus Kariarchaeaceae archaeon]